MTNQILGAVELGLVYGLMVLGVYITFRILKIPDLTVDGSITLGMANAMEHTLVDFLFICKTDLHLLGMHIYINILRLYCNMQHRKRITVLHGIRRICFLYRTVYHRAFYITPIDKIIHHPPVSAGNYRFPNKPLHLAKYFLSGYFN